MTESFTHDDLERAIDDAAREMTAGEPSSAFTAHVLARIERGESVRRSRRAAWILAPLAAAALLVVALTMLISHRRSPESLPPSLAERATVDAPKPPAEVGALHRGDQQLAPGAQTPEPRTENPEPRTENREPRTRTLNPEPPPSLALDVRELRWTRRSAVGAKAGRTLNPSSGASPSDVAAMAPARMRVESIGLAPIDSGDSLQLPQLQIPPSLDIAPLDTPDIEKEIRR